MKRPPYRSHCRTCERERREDELFSWTGQCERCGLERMAENVEGLAEHAGPALERWRRGMAASVGATLREDT